LSTVPPAWHEGEAVAVELLHDEALAAEEADRELLLEVDAERDAARGAEEASFWQISVPPSCFRSIGQDLARVRRGEGDARLPRRRCV
jgi:hypothetical protein